MTQLPISSCPTCSARPLRRVYLTRESDAEPIFADAFECSAIYLWGVVAPGASRHLRLCESPPPLNADAEGVSDGRGSE